MEGGMRVLEINVNRCGAAHDLLVQTTKDRAVDLVLISEPNHRRSTGRMMVDERVDAAIVAIGVEVMKSGKGEGYVWVELRKWWSIVLCLTKCTNSTV